MPKVPQREESTQREHKHIFHESSDTKNIYRSCQTCTYSETLPRK